MSKTPSTWVVVKLNAPFTCYYFKSEWRGWEHSERIAAKGRHASEKNHRWETTGGNKDKTAAVAD